MALGAQPGPLLVVDLDSAGPGEDLDVPGLYPGVVCGIGDPDGAGAALAWRVDVALTSGPDGVGPPWTGPVDANGAIDTLEQMVASHPQASAVFVQLLRAGTGLGVAEGLLSESLAYSTLQSGPEFASWLARRPPSRPRPAAADPVRLSREGSTLAIALNRPEVHNAYNSRVRELLCDALTVALVDETVDEVVLRGEGPSFCSGGDLDEFGTFADPVSAHLLRTERSPGWLIHRLGDRMTARTHGSCVGSGAELAAFAARVEAAPGTRFRLPELAMGLIPGAGGTVSLPARIGRQRTAWMGLSGQFVDAETALAWGLVDWVGDVTSLSEDQ